MNDKIYNIPHLGKLIILLVLVSLYLSYSEHHKKKTEFSILNRKKIDGQEITNINEMFINTVRRYPESPALLTWRDDIDNTDNIDNPINNSQWLMVPYIHYYYHCKQFSKVLSRYDIKVVCIIGNSAPGWYYSHMGTIMSGGVSVGIHPSATSRECREIMDDTKCELLVVSNNSQLQKFLVNLNGRKNILERFPHLKAIVSYSSNIPPNIKNRDHGVTIFNWQQFINSGDNSINKSDFKIEDGYKYPTINPQTVATVIYTSNYSTTQRGVLITHANIISSIKNILTRISNLKLDIVEGDIKFIGVSDLHSINAQLMELFLPMAIGGGVYFGDNKTINSNRVSKFTPKLSLIKRVKPTILFCKSNFWTNLKYRITDQKKRWDTFDYLWNMLKRGFMRRMVTNNILKKYGLHKSKLLISGGNKLPLKTRTFYWEMRVNLHDMYGLTETTGPITFNSNPLLFSKLNSVGTLMNNLELKLQKRELKDKFGELLIKGSSVSMGYLNAKVETNIKFQKDNDKEKDQNKWFRTGDLVHVDKDGYLYLKGRLSDIIINYKGDAIVPSTIETRILNEIPIISNVMVVGDREKYLSAIMTIKTKPDRDGYPSYDLTNEVLSEINSNIESNDKTSISLIDDLNFKDYMKEKIKIINRTSPTKSHKIKKWVILPTDFTPENGELSSSGKLRRHIILQKYSDEIESLYPKSKTDLRAEINSTKEKNPNEDRINFINPNSQRLLNIPNQNNIPRSNPFI